MELTATQKRDLVFIKNINEWPNWPLLPLKRRVKDKFPLVGVLYDNGIHSADLSFAEGMTIWDTDEEKWKNAKWVKTTPEQLVADGWEVD